MIDTTTEHLMTLTETAAYLPLRNGRKVSNSCLWRWSTQGVKGVKLEHVRLGGTIMTSREALSRFQNKLAKACEIPLKTQKKLVPISIVDDTRVLKESERAVQEMTEAGI